MWVLSGKDGSLIRMVLSERPGFGRCILGGHDLNGDEYADFIVASHGEGLLDRPRLPIVEVFSGADAYPLFELRGPDPRAAFGRSLALGDVNGDGVSDIVVGAPSLSEDIAGYVHVFSGVDGALLHTVRRDVGQHALPRDWFGFGWGVGALPDLDGDGRAEFLASDPEWPGGENGLGRLDVFSGSDASLIRSLVFDGETGGDGLNFGWVLVSLGDVDADGLPDLGITAPDAWVRVYSGRSFELLFERTFFGGYMYSGGSSMAGLGDLDQDAHADFVYAANETALDTDPGYAVVVSGKTGTGLHCFTEGDKNPCGDGRDACGLGDVNGDGVGDLAVAQRDGRVVRCYSGAGFRELWSRTFDELEGVVDGPSQPEPPAVDSGSDN